MIDEIVLTETQVYTYCDHTMRESDGYCWICSSCSGPSLSNIASDYPFPEGVEIWRGGRHGSCRFVVKKKETEA